MIFQHTLRKVLSGEKTLTSRIAYPGDCANHWHMGGETDMTINEVLRRRSKPTPYGDVWRSVYVVDKSYALQPSRTAKAVGRFTIVEIKRYDVRDISEQEAQAEGFARAVDFLILWCQMHDKRVLLPTIPDAETGLINWADMQDTLAARPAERYQAWQLRLRVNPEQSGSMEASE